MPIAYDEDEQQHRDDGCEQHPANGCSNHSGVDVLTRFSCNTAQSRVARRSTFTLQASHCDNKIGVVSPPSGS